MKNADEKAINAEERTAEERNDDIKIKNANGKKVSVIIPVCNRGEFIRDCVDSVLAQTYGNIEILVIYEESEDDSLEILESYGDSIRIIEKEPSRNEEGKYIVSMARNEGFRHATGEYVSFMDVDDFWAPSKVEKQVKILDVHPGVGVVYTYVVNVNGEGVIVGLRDPWPWVNRMKEFWSRKRFHSSTHTFIRKELINKVGLLDESLTNAEDCELLIRLMEHCDLREVPEYLTYVRLHPKQKHRDLVRLKRSTTQIASQYDVTFHENSRFRNVWSFAIRFIEKYLLRDYKYYAGEPLRETWKKDDPFKQWDPRR